MRECIMALMVSHLVLQLPTLYIIYPAFKYFGLRSDLESLPGTGEVILHLLIFVAINDTYVPDLSKQISDDMTMMRTNATDSGDEMQGILLDA